MTIPALRFYEIYNAVGLHFRGGSYDYYKYGGKTKVNEASLMKSRAKHFFIRMCHKMINEQDAESFVVSNYVSGKKWIGEFDKKTQSDWEAYQLAINYNFEKELRDLWNIHGYEYFSDCVLDMMELGDESRLRTLILFDIIMNGTIFERLNKTFKDNILWDELYRKLKLIRPFVEHWNLDISKLRIIAKKVLSEAVAAS